jgi:hypothetical protein
MKLNMGRADKTLRFIAGVIIIALGLYFNSWWGAIGLIPLVTSLVGWCPLYVPFKITTLKSK